MIPSVGVTLKEIPLQVVVEMELTVAVGFNVTVTVNIAPVQAPEVGVTV